MDSVEKVQELKNKNRINIITPAEVFNLSGNKKLQHVYVKNGEDQIKIEKTQPKNLSDQKKQSLWSGQISASQTSRDLNTIQQRNGSIDERKQELSDTRIQLKLQYNIIYIYLFSI